MRKKRLRLLTGDGKHAVELDFDWKPNADKAATEPSKTNKQYDIFADREPSMREARLKGVGHDALHLAARYLRGEEADTLVAPLTCEQWRTIAQVATAADKLECPDLLAAAAKRLAGYISARSERQISAWLNPPPPTEDLARHWFNRREAGEGEEPYKGLEQALLKEHVCFAWRLRMGAHHDDCSTLPKGQLFTCSRCKVARYCSVECQSADWPVHQEDCKMLCRHRIDTDRQGEHLTNAPPWCGGKKMNFFETRVGKFWDDLTARDYCRSRHSLMLVLEDVAHHQISLPLYETVLEHQLELLRLTKSDCQGMREALPYTLLGMNRVDECFGFIKYWMSTKRKVCDAPTWAKGEWIFDDATDINEDIFENFNEDDIPSLHINWLVALAAIKMRRVMAHKQSCRQFDTFVRRVHPPNRRLTNSQANVGRLSDAVMAAIRERVVLFTEEVAEKQQAHMVRYLRMIDKANHFVLPAMVEASPLLDYPPPLFRAPGSAAEAYYVVKSGRRWLMRVLGSELWLEKIIGKIRPYTYGEGIEWL